jgi:hypothetical protein
MYRMMYRPQMAADDGCQEGEVLLSSLLLWWVKWGSWHGWWPQQGPIDRVTVVHGTRTRERRHQLAFLDHPAQDLLVHAQLIVDVLQRLRRHSEVQLPDERLQSTVEDVSRQWERHESQQSGRRASRQPT